MSLIQSIKKMYQQNHCHHNWVTHIGVKFLGYQSYSFQECSKCGKKEAYH